MIDAISDAYTLFLHVIDTLPLDWRAMFGAVVGSMMLTQWFKFYLPDNWYQKERSLAAELIGLVCGALVVLVYDPTANRLLHAIIAGLAGPLLYRIAIALTLRQWPEVAATLSQDKKPCGP